MSEEDVELVRRLQPPEQVDLTAMFRDENFETVMDGLAPLFDDEFEVIVHALSENARSGLPGLRQTWLDWLEPWESYRTEVEQISDAGDRVLVFTRDFGRRRAMDDEVELFASAVWTVREGKVVRAEFFTDRADALEAAGLSE